MSDNPLSVRQEIAVLRKLVKIFRVLNREEIDRIMLYLLSRFQP